MLPECEAERPRRGGWWAIVAMLVAVVPVGAAFSLHRIFCVRDLTLFFWGRHLWLRRSLLSGEWPLWDPYLGGGQSAAADALHQMFLLPVLAIRLIGTEVIGFNLWVALPFPLAALGTWLFLRRRFSAAGSALGAIAFAVSGPVVSTGNFPNLSWSVAAMPWVMWAVDRCLTDFSGRATGVLALAFAFQALSGEPVTMTATAVVALAYAIAETSTRGRETEGSRTARLAGVVAGVALGGALAAIQLVPLAEAVANSWRLHTAVGNSWSLHPLSLADVLSVHLSGDYFAAPNFTSVPWMLPLNSGRDPFFYSIYLGTTLLALALFGAMAGGRRVSTVFWTGTLGVAVLAAFGPHTPFYPFVRAHLPLIGSFRFPVKYLIVAVLALSVLVAAGWDAIASEEQRLQAPRRYRWAQRSSVALALAMALVAYLLSALALYFPKVAARQYFDLAQWLGIQDAVEAARFMLRALPAATTRVVLLSLGAGLFLAVASTRRREGHAARIALFLLLVVDLVASAHGINPTLDARYVGEPGWVSTVKRHPETRFYFGGKVDGTLSATDIDAPRRYRQEPGMSPVEARSTLSNEAVFFPSGRQVREMFAFDLAELWPRPFGLTVARFLKEGREGRDRFLANAGVRFRVLPSAIGAGHPTLAALRYAGGMHLFDWGPGITRASVVEHAVLVADVRKQIDGMFDPAFDPRTTVMVGALPLSPAGVAGSGRPDSAHVVRESSGRVEVEASAAAGGGYLVLLDTYTPDWKARVDGVDAPIVRANALFRAVRLSPGRHTVEFRYRPAAVYRGGASTLFAGLITGLLLFARRRGAPPPAGTFAPALRCHGSAGQ